MNQTFFPDLSKLPGAQVRLWAELKDTPENFVLYGGTAISLHLGHRISVDFDFFSNEPFDPDQLIADLPYLDNAEVLESKFNNLTCLVDRGGSRPVQIQLFGGLDLNRVCDPLRAKDNNLQIASLADLAGMKIAVVQKRAKWKDFVDVGAILESGRSLADAVAAAQAIYGRQFNSMIALKALSYHNDIDLSDASPGDVDKLNTSLRLINRGIAGLNINNLPKVVAKTGFRHQWDKQNEIGR